MCTVTYVPFRKGAVITANRDETPVRNADGLTDYFNSAEEKFLIAKEPVHGGTNIAIGQRFTSVLLNGAFYPHERKVNYIKSRGLVVLDSLNFSLIEQFRDYDFNGVEPFTLLRFGAKIEELRWDEKVVHCKTYDPSNPLIVASAKLYGVDALEKRNRWFHELLQRPSLSSREIWEFHLHGGDGDPENDMVMKREYMVRTISITQISEVDKTKEVKHLDLVLDKQEEHTLKQ